MNTKPGSERVVNTHCPWSGKPVSQDSLADYRGRRVGFCNPGCRDKFEAALALFDPLIDALDQIPSS